MTDRPLPPPPIPGSPFAASRPVNAKHVAIVVSLVAILSMPFLICGGCFAVLSRTRTATPPPTPAITRAQDLHSAWYQDASRRVKLLLKSPASAEFPGVLSRDYTVDYSTPGQVTVSSFVDAQNSFGAKLRQQWVVILKHDDKFTKTTAIYIKLGPDVLLDLRPRPDK